MMICMLSAKLNYENFKTTVSAIRHMNNERRPKLVCFIALYLLRSKLPPPVKRCNSTMNDDTRRQAGQPHLAAPSSTPFFRQATRPPGSGGVTLPALG